jgi:K+-transporting ATPase KdpF subunit
MRALEVMSMHIDTATLFFISIALFVYLIYALLRPEKF